MRELFPSLSHNFCFVCSLHYFYTLPILENPSHPIVTSKVNIKLAFRYGIMSTALVSKVSQHYVESTFVFIVLILVALITIMFGA